VKLAGKGIEDFLRRPPAAIRAVLVYGPDTGLVRERADRLTAGICPDLKDPFRISELTGAALSADPARLADEAAALSLVGGRRVVRVREAGDAVTPILAAVLAGTPGDSLILVEAGDLPGRSSLRKLCEGAATAAALPCYADSPRELAEIVRDTFAQRKITVSGDAISYLVAHLGGDRLVTRGELEKLALFAGDGGRVELADAVACVGDTTLLSVEELIYAASEGAMAALETLLARCLAEGEAPISLLRAAMRHFHRLHLAAARMEAGASAEEAMRLLRPPLFFKLQPRFRQQLDIWRPRRVAGALDALTRAELDGKRSILPQETVLREALFTIARAARR
jgi:DNA polymerase-3 subunit delta